MFIYSIAKYLFQLRISADHKSPAIVMNQAITPCYVGINNKKTPCFRRLRYTNSMFSHITEWRMCKLYVYGCIEISNHHCYYCTLQLLYSKLSNEIAHTVGSRS